jgi:hypothetical protein
LYAAAAGVKDGFDVNAAECNARRERYAWRQRYAAYDNRLATCPAAARLAAILCALDL